MSFVGPRPFTPAELATHYRDATAEPGLIEQWNMLIGTIPRASS